jgi:hypothetical protein
MFQAGEKAEVIATGEQVEIVMAYYEGPVGGKQILTKCTVRFADGTTQDFHDENELKKLEGEPSISPEEPLA